MRVMVIVKASPESEAGRLPTRQMLEAMGAYNEALASAGILVAGEGLQPSTHGKRVRFEGPARTVTDGPFAATPELISGYWIWRVQCMEDAVDWLERAPFDGGAEVELRPIMEAEDFGAALTPELRAQEERLRQSVEATQ